MPRGKYERTAMKVTRKSSPSNSFMVGCPYDLLHDMRWRGLHDRCEITEWLAEFPVRAATGGQVAAWRRAPL